MTSVRIRLADTQHRLVYRESFVHGLGHWVWKIELLVALTIGFGLAVLL